MLVEQLQAFVALIQAAGYDNIGGLLSSSPSNRSRGNPREAVHDRCQETDMATKRTTHRSSKGTKLYAVRDKKGQFKDIQSYKRAHGADVKRKSKKEK